MTANQSLTMLVKVIKEASTGALAWQHDKKRRMVWLEGGQAVLFQSNLKSETPERVAEKNPGLGAEELARRVQEARLRGLLSEAEGEVRFTPGIAPQKEQAEIVALLMGVGDLLPEPGAESYPRVQTAPILARLPIDPGLRTYLWEMDGTRDLEEVTSFAPAHPDVLNRALRVAFLLGAVVDAGRATTATTVTGQAEDSRSTATGIFPAGWETARPPAPPARKIGIHGLEGDDLFGSESAPDPAPRKEDPIKRWFGAHHERIHAAADHFQTLGVHWENDPESMRRAYFALARDLHPDRFNDAPADIQQVANDLFDRVRAAWEVLGDDVRRAAYIAKVIRGEKTEEEQAAETVAKIFEGETLFRKAVNELNSGRVAQAHDLLTRACELVPEELEFKGYLGYTTFRVHFGKNDAKNDEMALAGLESLRAVLKEREQLDNVWVLLGLIQRQRGDDTAARRAFIKALQIKPSNPDAVREMKRLEQTKAAAQEEAKSATGGFFSRLFGKK